MRRALPYLLPLLMTAALFPALAADAKPAPAKKPAPPPPPPLEAPQPLITWIFPAGAQRGKTVEVTATGTNLVQVAPRPDVNRVTVTGEGVTARVIEAKDPNQARLSVTVAADAEPGMRELRIITPGGISNRYRFMVGELPEINEAEPNSDKQKPQALPALPLVVNGQIMEADRDYFRFAAKAGQNLVITVEARTLLPYIADAVPGWFDAVVAVYDSTGKEVSYADDFRFHPDPVLLFRVPRDGDYTLELRDIIYRGRGDFIYRMRIGEVPYVTDIFPLGGQRGHDVDIELHGVNLPKAAARLHLESDAPARLTLADKPFATGTAPEVREAEPNDTQAKAQRVTLPAAIDGRIDRPGDTDWYTFAARAGEKFVFEIQARRLDSPVDSILTLFNSKGAVLMENDDWTDPWEALVTHHADSRIAWTAPTAGDYALRIRDVQAKGGQEYAYRLLMGPPQPDFGLRIVPDNLRVGRGDTTAITVNAVRKDGLDGEIRLSVEGLPEGFVVAEASIPAGQDVARLTVTAPPDAPVGLLSPKVVGTAVAGQETIRRTAEAAEAVMQAFAWTFNIPAKQLFMAVIQPAAYTIEAKVDAGKVIEVKQDTEVPIVVRIKRQGNAKAGVICSAARPANGITVKSAFIPPDKDEGTLTVTVTKDAKPGLNQNIIISGVMKQGKDTVTRYARAVPIQVVAADKK